MDPSKPPPLVLPAHTTLGKYLRDIRIRHGSSLDSVPGVDGTELDDYENGFVIPRRDRLRTIIDSFHGDPIAANLLFERATEEKESIDNQKRATNKIADSTLPNSQYIGAELTTDTRTARLSGIVSSQDRQETATVHCGDALIIGAGASGILTARNLTKMGLAVTLVDRNAIGYAQSNHSHGYMHRGHIYQKPAQGLVDALNSGADRWKEEFSTAGIEPLNRNAVVAFENSYNAEVASRAWQRAGLVSHRLTEAAGLRTQPGMTCFETFEETYDFTPWFHYANSSFLADTLTISGAAYELKRTGSKVDGIFVRTPSRNLLLTARFYILAAGTGNLGLVQTATNFRGRALNRMSFMLVLSGRDLPKLSLVSPENATNGLFMVSRHEPAADYWLVSNFVSFSGSECNENAAAMWARSIYRTLSRFTTVLELESGNWGIYRAPKGELRTNRNRLDKHSLQSYGLENLIVAAPTKLTLCPLLADEVAKEIRSMNSINSSVRRYADNHLEELRSPLPVAHERWKRTNMHPLSSLRELSHRPLSRETTGLLTREL
ncbi:FAD-dependent oxidoreductase [Rhodococcus pyridinivorans]|uniref:FAD-dependent oxidoreductase n=1 Tax=Rhodococcus pyridinivorans TaxID=103816 RepID=UPI0003014AD6|nr:FAD-dependent oxidoreductase [Rhodococcus pyridinivorans]MCD2139760.1 FAD-binding oxidoreductase [Rhodococcus pyridinivorans]